MAESERPSSESGLPARADRHPLATERAAAPTLEDLIDSEGLDWKRLLYVLWERKWWIALATAVGIAAGFYLSNRIEPVYESRGTLWLGAESGGRGPIEGVDVLEGRGWADLLSSAAVLEPVVRDLRLNLTPASPEDAELFRNFELRDSVVAGSYALKLDGGGDYSLRHEVRGVVEQGSLSDPVGESVGFSWQVPGDRMTSREEIRFHVAGIADAVGSLRGRLTVLYNREAGNLLTTRLRGSDGERAARIHNAILESFMELAFDLKSQKMREVVEILRQQTEYAAARLDSAEFALENYRVQTITLPSEPRTISLEGGQLAAGSDPVLSSYFERRLNVDQLRSDLDQLEGILQRVRDAGDLDALALQMIPSAERSSGLQQALSELSDKEAKRRSLLYQYTENHPAVQQVSEEIRVLRQETVPQRLTELVQQLRSRLSAMQQDLESQAAELSQIPTRSIELARRERRVENAEQLHQNLQSRLKEAELAASTSIPNIQVVDRATPPTSPTSNEGPRIFLMASLAGFGLGLGGVLLHDRLDEKVQTPGQVSSGLGLPVLGMVPQIGNGKGADRTQTMEVLESFRAIRGQLARKGRGAHQVILVTSPAPREGKSLVAANLAISFASAGVRTLIVDVDTRRGNVEQLFGLPSKPGLTDRLHGTASLPETVRPTDVENLDLLPHGELRGFNADLLASERMSDLLEDLRRQYDVVVLDGPPLVAGVDPLVVGERSDKVVLVLRTGQSDVELARSKLDSVGDFDFPLVGAVLNDVPGYAPYYSSYYSSYPIQVEGEVVA